MSVYEKADELAEELKNCEEVVELRNAGKEIIDSEENKKIIDDFRHMQMDAYSEQMKNGVLSEETKKRFNDMAAVMDSNPAVSKYIHTEEKFTMMWQKILDKLNTAIGIDFSFGADNK
jgi:cell fate (sporulation/competence/biofilm development) regulator YlbF (YheA/YmcA/DUF963 family)